MNQPTEDRIKRLEEEQRQLKEEVRQLKEQHTEPIRFTDNALLQTLVTMAGTQATDIGVLKTQMEGARADITSIKATLSDHGEMLKEILKHIKKGE